MKALFPTFLGNEEIKNRIGGAILADRSPHAFLIDGDGGAGKRTLTRLIAAALNCERRRTEGYALPCLGCDSCRKIISGAHVDVKELSRSSDRATVGVAEVKTLREDMFLSATEAEKKVYIIDDAERLTPEAQNALLIMLEEPPKNVVILLLASGTDRILTTVKSRTQYIALSRFTPDRISDYIRKNSEAAERLYLSDRAAFDAAVMAADGSIGRALSLIDPREAEGAREMRERAIAFVRACAPRAGFAELKEATDAFPTKRAELSEQLELAVRVLRDMIAVKRADNPPTVFFPTAAEARAEAEPFKINRLISVFEIVMAAHDDCNKNGNVTALVTAMAGRIHLLKN
ncbi:MAG: hypothetical protein IKL79_00150 [Clostridia bacterium]|nr:hypothetical protein [Clostridia bacterium]